MVEPHQVYDLSEFYLIKTKDIVAHKQETQIKWYIMDWVPYLNVYIHSVDVWIQVSTHLSQT